MLTQLKRSGQCEDATDMAVLDINQDRKLFVMLQQSPWEQDVDGFAEARRGEFEEYLRNGLIRDDYSVDVAVFSDGRRGVRTEFSKTNGGRALDFCIPSGDARWVSFSIVCLDGDLADVREQLESIAASTVFNSP